MQKAEINPPEQDQFEAEHRALYVQHHMGAVISFSGIGPSTFSRRLNDTEPTRDHLYDVVMEMFGTVMTKQPEVGKGIVRIVNRFAAEFGLIDQPISILKLAIDQLRQTSRDDIKAMSRDDRVMTEMYSAELREVAGHVHSDAVGVRNELDGAPRGVEIGNGRGVRA